MQQSDLRVCVRLHWQVRVKRLCRLAITLLILTVVWLTLWHTPALAQDSATAAAATAIASAPQTQQSLPLVWYLLAAGLAMLVPAGFVLLASATLSQGSAWNAALGGLAAAGVAAFAYWAVGFALQFGGVGLVYQNPELRNLVWEWSPLSSEWGIGWGMAGLAGWFVSGAGVTVLAYSLFLAHLPWVILAAALPVMALRGRAPSTVTLVIALVMGGVVYPLAGNWVQGGGWLNALGRNMALGHGFVDPGGAGSVHLVAAGFALAALSVWSTRRTAIVTETLPPAHQPLLAVVGALLVLGGGVGWQMANPLQVETMGSLGMVRGSVSLVLSAAGGMLFPLLYTWFVTGSSEPTLAARGFAAGFVAGLASGPFVQPGIAFVIGLLAGATVPFVAYLLDGRLRLQDRTGVLASSGVPAVVGLLLVGIFADGVAGSGWQVTGAGSYLGVSGQGVSGMLVSNGFQADFPGQIQAQIIGVTALALWGFLAGLIVCVPLGLLFHALLTHEEPAGAHQGPQLERQPTWREGNPSTTTVNTLPAVAGVAYRSAPPADEPWRGAESFPAAPAWQPPAPQPLHQPPAYAAADTQWPADAAAVYAAQSATETPAWEPQAPDDAPPAAPVDAPADAFAVAELYTPPPVDALPVAEPYTPPPVDALPVAEPYIPPPVAPPPAAPAADPYQDMEEAQAPSAGTLLDAALENGDAAEAQNGAPAVDVDETQLIAPLIGSPLTRRRRPPFPPAPPPGETPHG